MLYECVSEKRQREVQKLKDQIEAFQAAGGVITTIPYGVRARDETQLEKYDLAAQMTIEANEAKQRRIKHGRVYNSAASTDF